MLRSRVPKRLPVQGRGCARPARSVLPGPDNVRKVEFFHQPPGREHVRVTVEYVSGEVKVFEAHKGLLTSVLAQLFAIGPEL